MSIVRIHWLRHAPPINPGNICYGPNIAVDLSDGFALKCQADRLPKGADWKASPMPRAMETALALLFHRPLGEAPLITIEPREKLKEQSFGDWVDKPRILLPQEPGFGLYMADPVNNAPPNGESIAQTAQRTYDDMDDLVAAKPNGGDYVVVGHKGNIRIAVARTLDLPLKETLRIAIDPLSLTVIEYDHDKKACGKNPWTLESLNLKP